MYFQGYEAQNQQKKVHIAYPICKKKKQIKNQLERLIWMRTSKKILNEDESK